MNLYHLLDSIEDRLLDVYLFIRYFDFTDLGFTPQDGSDGRG
jgi:hypothetical protein